MRYTSSVKEGTNKMLCKHCNTEMKAGMAIVPVWGTMDGRPIKTGTTLSMVDGSMMNVLKCPECGYSVYLGNLIIRNEEEV